MENPVFAKFAQLFDPEKAHGYAIKLLKQDFLPIPQSEEFPPLRTHVMGLDFPNPVGLAAGFDKNAEVYSNILRLGFGFAEVGTVTPLAQAGNPKPRVFRLPEARGIINRLGFNGEGADAVDERLPAREDMPGIVGVNIGKNKNTQEALADYLPLLRRFYPKAAYITANISSPNTEGLRDLQRREHFEHFARTLRNERDGLAASSGRKVPLLIKIAPDVSDAELEDIVGVSLAERIDGLIVGNTTISRPEGATGPHRDEAGGLSGRPLMPLSTEVLRKTYRLSKGQLTLVGVGGIYNAADVLAKIKAGASLVQLYTALAYQGFGVAYYIKRDLVEWMKAEGVGSLDNIRGVDAS